MVSQHLVPQHPPSNNGRKKTTYIVCSIIIAVGALWILSSYKIPGWPINTETFVALFTVALLIVALLALPSKSHKSPSVKLPEYLKGLDVEIKENRCTFVFRLSLRGHMTTVSLNRGFDDVYSKPYKVIAISKQIINGQKYRIAISQPVYPEEYTAYTDSNPQISKNISGQPGKLIEIDMR